MYSFDQSLQPKLFFLSLGIGFVLGLFYDILRTLRLALPHSKILTVIFDIFYFFVSAVVTFLFLLSVNMGQVRLFMIAAEAVGALFYYFTFGSAAMKVTDRLVRRFHKACRFLCRLCGRPFHAFFRILKKYWRKIQVFFKKTYKKSEKNKKKLLKKSRIYVYNLFGILGKRKGLQKEAQVEMAKSKKKAKKQPISIILLVLAILFVSYLVISIVSEQFKINRKKDEYNELTSQLQQQLEENSELAEAVSNNDEAALAEQYARQNGYAYPDEHVYVDATPGETD